MSDTPLAGIDPSAIDIVYVAEGRGRQAARDRYSRETEGELYMIPASDGECPFDPGTSHSEVVRCRFNTGSLGMAAPLAPMKWKIDRIHDEEMRRLLMGMSEANALSIPHSAEIRTDHWSPFMALLLFNPDSVVLQPYESDESPIRQALNVMGYRFMTPLSVAEISRLVAMSTRHFQRMFKTLTGRSFVKMLQEIRIRHSCGLLQFSKLSVQSVAEAVGFSDMYHFYRLFRTYCGMTPAAFRLRHRH